MRTSQLVKYTFALSLSLFFSLSIFAQNPPTNILNGTDIDHFIKSFNPLKADLNELEVAYDDVQDAWTADAKIKAVFAKHGWGDDFVPKFQAIIASYAYLKSMKEFDNVPAEQKQLMTAVMEQVKAQYASMVSDADIALVKTRFNALDKVLQED